MKYGSIRKHIFVKTSVVLCFTSHMDVGHLKTMLQDLLSNNCLFGCMRDKNGPNFPIPTLGMF